MAFYYNKQVLGAGVGGIAGVIIGGVAAAILGAAAATAWIGCATVILCLFALIVAVIIAIIGAIAGSIIGSQVGKAATPTTTPSGTVRAGGLMPIQSADYISVQGNLAVADFLEGEAVLWWVYDFAPPGLFGTALHGESKNRRFPFHRPRRLFQGSYAYPL